MIETIRIVGARGRVGSTVSARLAERGLDLDSPTPQLVLVCVPDRAIAEVAAETPLRTVDRTRERRDAARRTRAPRSALRTPSAAVVLQGSRPRAARRRLGRGDGGDG